MNERDPITPYCLLYTDASLKSRMIGGYILRPVGMADQTGVDRT